MNLNNYAALPIILLMAWALTPVVSPLAAIPGELTAVPEPIRVTASSDVEVGLSYELSGLTRETFEYAGESFDVFSLDGEPPTGYEGNPELPCVQRVVLIPPQSGVSVRIERLVTHLDSDVNPLPRQQLNFFEPSFQTMGFGGGSFPEMARTVDLPVGDDGFWPPQAVSLGEPGILRGWRLIPVAVHPLRWNPKTGQMQVVEAVDFRLDFNSTENMTNLVRDPERPRPSRQAQRLLRSIVLNPPPEPGRDEVSQGGSIVYIIGPDGQLWNPVFNALQPLVEWRRKMGWKAEILRIGNTESIAQVKEAIQDAYDNWEYPPEYILLCGGIAGDTQWKIALFNAQRGVNFPYESDFEYTRLEGGDDDYFPEAAIGRMVFTTLNAFTAQIDKVLEYESDPDMGEDEDEADWFINGACASTDRLSGISSNNVCRWVRALAMDRGFTEVDEFYFGGNNGNQPNPTQFINDHINAGISFLFYRGGINMTGYDFNGIDNLRNGGKYPFAILATCNTGDFQDHMYSGGASFAERFSRCTDGGTIGVIGTGGATHTAYNNLIAATIMRGIFVEGLHTQGWALARGRAALSTHYQGRGDINHDENHEAEAWWTELMIFNLFGDPAVDLYTAIPAQLSVVHPAEIRAGESRFEVRVLDAENEEPVADAVACLYKAGEDGFQVVIRTDDDGRAEFLLDPATTEEGDIHLTITGHNLKAYLREFEVAQAATFFGAGDFEIDDDNNGASRGNNNSIANPGETIELTVNVYNYGSNNVDDNAWVELQSLSPLTEVLADSAYIEALPESDESAAVEFVFSLRGGFNPLEDAKFRLVVHRDQNTWRSSVTIPVRGSKMEFESLEWADEPLEPQNNADLRITLRNVGEIASPAFSGRLIPRTETVSAGPQVRQFASIQPDNTGRSEGLFNVSASMLHFINNPANFALVLQSESGILDTVFFSFIIEGNPEGAPFGPDDYGYICFDDTDENWFAKPEYDWVEINPRVQGGEDGTNTNLRDTGNEQDQSTVVNLPFNFKYYGQDFDRVTICTNGWMAMGDRRQLINFTNRQLPDGECVPGMLAPFWDELLTTNDGGIFHWFDEENHIFIVEWYRMRKNGPNGNNEPEETFQVKLYDPQHWPSFTGDGDIEFLYQDVNDTRSCFQEWDTPFASVGLVSPDLTTGLQYVYWNEYTPGAAPLEDGRIIKFTTLLEFRQGSVEGWVTDAATDAPIDSVLITTNFGFSTITNEDGYYLLLNMIASEENLYEITASKQGYNPMTKDSIEVLEDDTIRVEFALLHPEFEIVPSEYRLEWIADTVIYYDSLMLYNRGNGYMNFDSKFTYNVEDRDELWEPLLHWSVTDTLVLGQGRYNSIVFAEGMWWIAGKNQYGEAPQLYRFSRSGELIDSIPQPESVGTWGIRDMDYYNGYIYCASGRNSVIVIDPSDGQEVRRLYPPDDVFNRGLDVMTISSDGFLYITKLSQLTLIYKYEIDDDDTLTLVDSFNPNAPQTGRPVYKNGLTWFRDDPDGFNLYLMGSHTNAAPPWIQIYKINVETGQMRFLTDLAFLPDGSQGVRGITITPKWNNLVWVFATIFLSNEGQQAYVFELGPNSSWLTYGPTSGALDPFDSLKINLELNLADLDTGDYGVIIDFSHNAGFGHTQVPVFLRVLDSFPPDTTGYVDDDKLPREFWLSQNHPNPFNPSTSISFSLDRNAAVKLEVFDIAGRKVAELLNGWQAAGVYQLSFDAAALSNGVYFYRLESDRRILNRKMVILK